MICTNPGKMGKISSVPGPKFACSFVMEAKPHSQKFAQRHPRIAGLIVLFVALALAKWQIYNPLHAAEYGYTELHIWPKLIAFAIMLGLYGLCLCIFGSDLNESMPVDFNNINWKVAVAASGLAFFGLAVYVYVMISLNDQGYVHSYF